MEMSVLSGSLVLSPTSGLEVLHTAPPSGSALDGAWMVFYGVLAGGFLTGLFSIINLIFNNRSNRTLKIMDNNHQKNMLKMQQSDQRKVRLFEVKMKAFSEFYEAYPELFDSEGTIQSCKKMLAVILRLELLIPEMNGKLRNLQDLIVDLQRHADKTEKGDKEAIVKMHEICDEIVPLGAEIRDALPGKL